MNENAIKLSTIGWLSWLTRKIHTPDRITKIHDYSHLVFGVDYVFEQTPGSASQGSMTAQRKGVQTGDHIILMQNGMLLEYCIQELDYYSSPSDMWIAILMKVDT
jgi:hypothetical protein